MIAANCFSQLFRQHRSRGNFFGEFSKVTVMNNSRLAQDTFVFRQVISVFIFYLQTFYTYDNFIFYFT